MNSTRFYLKIVKTRLCSIHNSLRMKHKYVKYIMPKLLTLCYLWKPRMCFRDKKRGGTRQTAINRTLYVSWQIFITLITNNSEFHLRLSFSKSMVVAMVVSQLSLQLNRFEIDFSNLIFISVLILCAWTSKSSICFCKWLNNVSLIYGEIPPTLPDPLFRIWVP